ncbi:DUF7604 domain-containing protein [Oribacterium sp. FC2011]|uniref:DUF7604 domain-containing protein n=1 Tax=Oribacterium sp. FC2011 TaxID=1408311 RepID=UPI0004E0F0AB|nr:vWA domain-containing protein [Oribacterium sp. FC2011]
MKRAKYSIKKSIKKGLATLLSVCLIVSGVQTPVYAAEASIPTESTATVSGLVNKKVVLDLLSDDLRDAALTAIRENRLFDAGDYLGATSDSKKAIKEYEAFFNRNPGLYVVEVPDSVKDILSSEAESELRIFVQKDEKKAKVDLEDENAADESVLSRDVNFRYGTEDDIILYEPSSQIDTLVNGGEDAYYRDPEQDTADNSDYQLTGKEKITFMFINASDGAVRFTLKVDGVKYDSVEVCGRTAALKRVLAQAGVKKTEETTAAVVQTTQAVETTQAPELVNMEAGPTGTEELTQPGEENIQEGIADTSEIITPEDNENGSTEISNPVTAEQEAGAGESTDIENGADTEDNNQGYIEADTNTSQQELTENNAAEQTNDDTAVVTDDDSAELTNNDAAELTDNDTAEISDTEDNANVENEDGAQAQIEDIEDNEDSITDQISDAVDNVSNIILGRMVVYAEVIGEGYVFEEEQQGPETEEEEKNEDIAAEAGNTDGNDNDAADKQEIQADLDDNNGAAEGGQQGGQEYGQEEGQQDGQEIEQQSDGLGTETLEQNDGSGAEIAGQNEAGSGNESNVTIVDIFTEDNQEEGVQTDTTSTEISTGDEPVEGIEGTIPEGQMTLEDLTGMMAEPETTAAEEIQKPETTVKMPVASPSEVEETKGEYDDFAKELIAEVKEAVLEDKEAAKEELMVAKIVQYSIGSLGKIHYLTEIDGYSVEIFASQDAFGGFKPTLEVKRLYKPEEAEGNGEAPTDAQIAELKANGIYDNSLLLDISFKDDYGNEVEPNGNVKVKITLNDEQFLNTIDASSLEVHHIKDNNSTLKTEKVADTDDVKALDSSDDEIRFEGDEEEAVEVASAVAEFEVDSFSLFAITWYIEDNNAADIHVHYVDQSGTEILNNENGYTLDLGDGEVVLADYQGGVTNHDYLEARLGSVSGNVITRVKKRESSAYMGMRTNYYVDFFDASGNRVEQDSAGYEGSLTGSHISTVQKDIYLIYKQTEVQEGGEVDPLELDAPKTSKTLEDNGDGTYTLTLSVKGASKGATQRSQANVLVVLDTSGSMDDVTSSYVESTASDANYGKVNGKYVQLQIRDGKWKYKSGNKWYTYTGTRYKYISSSKSRLEVAKDSINGLAEQLFANNTPENPDNIEVGLITFSTKVNSTSGKYTTLSAFSSAVNGLSADGGTNWEAALLAANSYNFNDDDPVYVIFVSDGNPTFRQNANGYLSDYNYTYGVYGEGNKDSHGYCYDAAKTAATAIINANKHLYTINAFGDATNMQGLLSEEENYFEATDQAALNSAFSQIISIIQQDLSYANVSITDGLTNLTASVVVSGGTSNYTYKIVKRDDTVVDHEDVDSELKTAAYSDGSVVWNLGGTNYRLEDGATYSVSFIVWPKQDAYDTVADKMNDDSTEVTDSNLVRDSVIGRWTYKTNTSAEVTYQTVDVVTQDGSSSTTYSDPQTVTIDPPEPMILASTKLDIAKLWKLNHKDQISLIKDNSIVLALQKDGVDYRTGITLDNSNASISADELEITWTNDTEINVSPGILVSKAKGDEYGFSSMPGVELISGYYMIETGHDYKFTERSGNICFELEDITYHPMLVDGVMKNVIFSHDEGGHITGIESLEDVEELTTLTAHNVIKVDSLEVSKTYTGNMATAQETAFDLYLYNEDGTTPAVYTENYIETLNAGGTTVVKQSDGAYRFTITPTTLGTPATATIVLPSGVKYKVSEVKANKDYATYKTKWGVAENAITNESSITSIQVLGTVNAIYFVNENNVIAPTGFNDDMRPFMALALAGFGAMFFLACDFEKKRLFED